MRARPAKARNASSQAGPPTKRRGSRQRSKSVSSRIFQHRSGDLPAFIEPCLATLVDKAPQGARWVHEIKLDGYRLQARLDHGAVKLMTRKGLDWTAKFPRVAEAAAKLPAETALLDGEVVSEDQNGIPRFSLLQQDLKTGHQGRIVLYLFDLLHLDGADLRGLPLYQRKAKLTRLLARSKGAIRLSETLSEPGPALLKQACRMGLEGIVSKLADAPYRSGRGHDWLKAKCSDRQELVVTGFVPSTADAHAVGALVLGFYQNQKLQYAGRVGTGFTHDIARSLYRTLKSWQRKSSPFSPVPAEERGRHGAIWVDPQMVVEVDFHGWTHGGRVRQASFQGVRTDKPPEDVVREVKQ